MEREIDSYRGFENQWKMEYSETAQRRNPNRAIKGVAIVETDKESRIVTLDEHGSLALAENESLVVRRKDRSAQDDLVYAEGRSLLSELLE